MRGRSELDFELKRVVQPKSGCQLLRLHQNGVGGALRKTPLLHRLVRDCVFAALEIKISLCAALDPLLHVFDIVFGRVIATPGAIGCVHQALLACIQLRILT